jgi:hypothetical protein
LINTPQAKENVFTVLRSYAATALLYSNQYNFYKVAQLHIGSKKRSEKSGKTILLRNKKGTGRGRGTGERLEVGALGVSEDGAEGKKLSPYRTMDGGKLPPTKMKNNLSPIQENSPEDIRSRDPRKQPYVTWSDLKGN